MATTIHHCEKAIFPFTAKPTEWQDLCLSVTMDQKVRVVQRESAPARQAGTLPASYLWCVAQTENGALGLLPSLVLQRAGDDESFALSQVISPLKDYQKQSQQADEDSHPGQQRRRRASRHVDPFAMSASSDEGVFGSHHPKSGGGDPGARRTTARPSELHATKALNSASLVTVSSSTVSASSVSSDDDDDDSVCSFERCPGVQSVPLQIKRKPTRVAAATAPKQLAKKKTQKPTTMTVAAASVAFPQIEDVSETSLNKTPTKKHKTKKVHATSPARKQAEEMRGLRDEWMRVERECVWLRTEVQPAIESTIALAESELALAEAEQAKKAALVEKKQAAVAEAQAQQSAVARDAEALLATLEAVLKQPASPPSAPSLPSSTTGRELFASVDVNTSMSPVSSSACVVEGGVSGGCGGCSAGADRTLLDLVKQEAETLASYEAQEAKLRGRLERATALLARLHDESELLSVSEDALGAFLMEDVDYEVEAVLDAPKDAPPVRVVMTASQARGFAWPRALSGLTEEEQTALDTYVRLADKYGAKFRHESSRFGDLVDVDLDTSDAGGGDDHGNDVNASSASSSSPSRRVAKLRATLAHGDAEVGKLRDDIAQLTEFLTTYEPVAAQIGEQIAIGARVLKQKEADVKKLQQDKAAGVRL